MAIVRGAPHPFSLRQIQYALAVKETGGFRAAATLCAVSQPALSAQLALLERALGVVLFERDRAGVRPTSEGEALLPALSRLLVGADDVLEAARALGDPLSGRRTFGVIPTIAPYFLPDAAPVLAARFPKLEVVWLEEKTATLLGHLAAGRIDAALIALEVPLGDVDQEPLAADPFLLAVPRGHRLARGRSRVPLAELADETVLLLEDGHCLRQQALSACARTGIREAGFRATSLSTLVSMVAAGAGVTLLPAIAAELENRRGALALRRFRDPEPARTLGLVWRKSAPFGEALRAVGRALRPRSLTRQ